MRLSVVRVSTLPMRGLAYVALYLGAVILANLAVARFGPSATIVCAFFLIGLDLSSRDALHDAWHGRWLWPRMFALIATGSLLSWLLNAGAGRVAIASLLAFGAAGVVDAITYAVLGKRARLVRVNGSNVLAAAVDSLLFPTLAFGALMPAVILGQFAAKVGGGFLWSLVLMRWPDQARTIAR